MGFHGVQGYEQGQGRGLVVVLSVAGGCGQGHDRADVLRGGRGAAPRPSQCTQVLRRPPRALRIHQPSPRVIIRTFPRVFGIFLRWDTGFPLCFENRPTFHFIFIYQITLRRRDWPGVHAGFGANLREGFRAVSRLRATQRVTH